MSLDSRPPHPAEWTVVALGRFAVQRGDEEVSIPWGRQRRLVQLLVVRDGTAPVPTVIDRLWPDLDEAAGAARLRGVLHRLRQRAPIVGRADRDRLALVEGLEVDAIRFARAAAAALSGGEDAVEIARTAVGIYTGDLLPDAIFDDWLVAPRERLRQRYVALLDLLANDACRDNRLNEALRWHFEAIDVDPFDERRYLDAASILLSQGRRAKARHLARRAADMLADLGLAPSPELDALLTGRDGRRGGGPR